MKISRKRIVSLNPCQPGLDWYDANASHITDLKKLLLFTNNEHPDYARWLFTNLMSIKQRSEIAIYAAKQVLHIFEERYPNDRRPRNAIKAAEAVLRKNTAKNRQLARNAAAYYAAYAAAYYAAYAAADAAYAAYAAEAAYAADAAYAAYYAADAAYAAYAADASDKKGMQEKIILRAVFILNRDRRAK